MFEFLDKYDYLILPYLVPILRAFLIPFAALGVVSIMGRMLEIANSDKSRNVIAVIAMAVFAVLSGGCHGDLSLIITYDYIMNSVYYLLISVIIYIALCWRFYPRLDALLDKRVAQDDKSKEIDDERRKANALLRKAKREEKKVEEEKKRVERQQKKLDKK